VAGLSSICHLDRSIEPPRPIPGNGAGRAGTDRVRRQIARCDAVADHFDADRLAGFLDGLAASFPAAIDALFTLTSLIEEVADAATRSSLLDRGAATASTVGLHAGAMRARTASGE
jgi:hypothetical protein